MSYEEMMPLVGEPYAKRLAQRNAEWQKAVDKMSITFEADHDGGYPDILKGQDEPERLRILRSLGFRVVRRHEDDFGPLDGRPDIHRICELSCSITVDLTTGWVYRFKGRWRKRG